MGPHYQLYLLLSLDFVLLSYVQKTESYSLSLFLSLSTYVRSYDELADEKSCIN